MSFVEDTDQVRTKANPSLLHRKPILTDPSHIYYLNSDFDLSLHTHPFVNPALVRQVRELSVQALIGADKADAAWVRADVPSDFTAYLADNGVPVPQLLQHPQIDPARRLRPFGWNQEAIQQNGRYPQPAVHPPLSVVRRVNSRSFACGLEAELFPDDPRGTLVQSAVELETFLARASAKSEWVIKAEHGNAGLANRRLSSTHLSAADLRFVTSGWPRTIASSSNHGSSALATARWFSTFRSMSPDCAFTKPSALTAERWWAQSSTPNASPTFRGTLWPMPPSESPRASITRDTSVPSASMRSTGATASAHGFGRWWTLNARQAMTDGAYRLWQRLMPDRTLFYSFFNRRKLTGLPKELGRVVDALGRRRYDPSLRRGILLASPVRLGFDGETRTPGKLAVIFAAEMRSEIFALERWFRDEFEV